MNESIPLRELLEEFGYGDPMARDEAMRVLIAVRLTSGRKLGIDSSKRERVRAALGAALALYCARCVATATQGARRIVPAVDSSHCEACRGSANHGAIRRAATAMREAGAKKLLVVGGGPGVHEELRRLWPDDLKLQIVDGDSNDDSKSARRRMAWADVVVVWGGSILSHRVSKLYTDPGTPGREKVVTVMRRGIEAVAEEIAKRYGAAER